VLEQLEGVIFEVTETLREHPNGVQLNELADALR
jgi:hypothetical protein